MNIYIIYIHVYAKYAAFQVSSYLVLRITCDLHPSNGEHTTIVGQNFIFRCLCVGWERTFRELCKSIGWFFNSLVYL
jgi:hypothetical protein